MSDCSGTVLLEKPVWSTFTLPMNPAVASIRAPTPPLMSSAKLIPPVVVSPLSVTFPENCLFWFIAARIEPVVALSVIGMLPFASASSQWRFTEPVVVVISTGPVMVVWSFIVVSMLPVVVFSCRF